MFDSPLNERPAVETARTRRGRFATSGIVWACIDAISWAVAVVAATAFRYDFATGAIDWRGVALVVPVAVLLQWLFGLLLGLYRRRWRLASFDEIGALAGSVALGGITLYVLDRFVLDRPVPASVPIVGAAVALMLAGAARAGVRRWRERQLRPDPSGRRLLVFGGGQGGAQAITAMLRDRTSEYVPVAILDDDPDKAALRIMGVPVVGTRADVPRAASALLADALLIAIPSAPAELVRDLSDLAEEVGLTVRVLPTVGELFGDRVDVRDIRPVTESDLLGRHQVETDVEAIAGYLTGRRVLVTGAGGSIGSELCRHIRRFGPDRLVLLDRDESGLHGVDLSMHGRARLESADLVVADIRDRTAVARVFAAHRPEVVFHAAALKHVPLLERHAEEAVTVNIRGTQNVIDAAIDAGVERLVNVSTDKAADPCNVLGLTKRIAERLTADAAARTGAAYLSVRFGNVLGSRGSVLETFHAQIEGGGPVTVTHPQATRYFMTVDEAVQLLVQAGGLGRSGEVLLLEMGQPVKIFDMAQRLVDRAERPVAIEFIGLRPGEKLHEELLGAGETVTRGSHPLISHVTVPPLAPEVLDRVLTGGGPIELRAGLEWLCSATGQDVEASRRPSA